MDREPTYDPYNVTSSIRSEIWLCTIISSITVGWTGDVLGLLQGRDNHFRRGRRVIFRYDLVLFEVGESTESDWLSWNQGQGRHDPNRLYTYITGY